MRAPSTQPRGLGPKNAGNCPVVKLFGALGSNVDLGDGRVLLRRFGKRAFYPLPHVLKRQERTYIQEHFRLVRRVQPMPAARNAPRVEFDPSPESVGRQKREVRARERARFRPAPRVEPNEQEHRGALTMGRTHLEVRFRLRAWVRLNLRCVSALKLGSGST